jgi:riboflavin biosynthesis pyrimidine reductase
VLPAGPPSSVARIVTELGLWERPRAVADRPRVVLNMVSTVDGRASLDGRSGGIGDEVDRELFHGLRSAVDAVLVGAGTVRAERYGPIVRDPGQRALRRERGLDEEPLACIVSAQLELGADIPLLAVPEARVVILTPSEASLPAASRSHPGGRTPPGTGRRASAAHVDYVRTARDGQLDLAAALAQLHARFGVDTLLCEGGPHLICELLAAGLADELLLTLSPRLAGAPPDGALGIVAGGELSPPLELELLGVLNSGSSLFLRYGVPARECVSRETTDSSSLAR